MKQTKEEFLKDQWHYYDALETAEVLSNQLTQKIAAIKSLGFSVIILGDTVKVTVKRGIIKS